MTIITLVSTFLISIVLLLASRSNNLVGKDYFKNKGIITGFLEKIYHDQTTGKGSVCLGKFDNSRDTVDIAVVPDLGYGYSKDDSQEGSRSS